MTKELKMSTSLTDMFLNLATSITATILPSSDRFLRQASSVLIQMVGINVPQQSSINCHKKDSMKRGPRIRINRINMATSNFFNSRSYQNFLQHHKLKYQSTKTRFSSKRKHQSMFTIHENVEH